MALENILYKEDYYSLFPNNVMERETEKTWHLYVVNIARLCIQRNILTRLHTNKTSLIPAYKITITNHLSPHYISYLIYLYKCVGGIGFQPAGQRKIYSCSYQDNVCERFTGHMHRLVCEQGFVIELLRNRIAHCAELEEKGLFLFQYIVISINQAYVLGIIGC